MGIKRGNLELEIISQRELHEIAQKIGSIRAGSTKASELLNRVSWYERQLFSGTFYYALTENMKKSENRLLQNYFFLHNDHASSNSEEGMGFVYVIKGRKYTKQ